MNKQEARSKAYFIAANIIEGACNRLPELIVQAADAAEISQEDMQAIISEMNESVVEYLRSEAKYHRSLAQKPVRVNSEGEPA